MKKNQDLFHLIRSLSRTEKRYFTLDARKAGKRQSRYLQLFQAINEQLEYDEKKLKQQFKSGLGDDKARLYEAILRSMRDFRSQRSRAARIKEFLLDANFLYERGLYQQCQTRLDEAREIAIELNDQLARLEINRESRRVVNTILQRQNETTLSNLQEETHLLLGALTNEFRYLDLHDQLIREVQSRRRGQGQSEDENLEKDYASKLFGTAAPQSLRAKLRYYQSRAMYSQLVGDQEAVYKNFQLANDLWNEHPAYKAEEFNRYLDNAFNLLHATIQYEPARAGTRLLLDNLAAEEPASAHDRLVLFQRTATYRLVFAINFDFNRPAAEVLAPIEAQLKQYDLNPVSELTIRFNAAILQFIQGESEACERWLLSIIDLRKSQVRPDIVQASRLLRIITLLDQEPGYDFIEAQLRSEQRHLSKLSDNRLSAFSRFLLKTLKRILHAPSSEVNTITEQALAELTTKWQRLPLGLDELIVKWFQARLQRKALLEVM